MRVAGAAWSGNGMMGRWMTMTGGRWQVCGARLGLLLLGKQATCKEQLQQTDRQRTSIALEVVSTVQIDG
jgi:hypothetical protein